MQFFLITLLQFVLINLILLINYTRDNNDNIN